MSKQLSRRKIAEYIADQIAAGREVQPLLDELAAYLVESRQVRNAGLLVRSIENELEENGISVAPVTSARPLSEVQRKRIIEIIGAKDVRLKEVVDPSLIGGAKLEAPGLLLDASIRSKLTALTRAKI